MRRQTAKVIFGMTASLMVGVAIGWSYASFRVPAMGMIDIRETGGFSTAFHPETEVEAVLWHVSGGKRERVDGVTARRFTMLIFLDTDGKSVPEPVHLSASFFLITEYLRNERTRHRLQLNATSLGPSSRHIPSGRYLGFARTRYSQSFPELQARDYLVDGEEHMVYAQGDTEIEHDSLATMEDIVEYTQSSTASFLVLTLRKRNGRTGPGNRSEANQRMRRTADRHRRRSTRRARRRRAVRRAP